MALPAPNPGRGSGRVPPPRAVGSPILEPTGSALVSPVGHPLGSREIAHFWSVGAGQLDSLGVRAGLWQSWGWCGRHTLGFLAVEAAVERGWLFQAAVLYDELMQHAARALAPHWLFERARIEVALEGSGCPACEAGLTRAQTPEGHDADLVDAGGSLEPLRAFASETRPWWMPWVCGACAGSGAAPACRPHLRAALRSGADVDLPAQRALVGEVARHAEAFAASFSWGRQGSATPADRAGLIGAAGWCAGWRAILEWLR